nr:ANTAR domain-containing protein [Lachnospiraceae bacterium]
MPKTEDIRYSALIVSSSEQFTLAVKKYLKGFITIDSVGSISLARRFFLERYYDLIIVNAPLSDEPGEEFVLDASDKSNSLILFVVPESVYNGVCDRVMSSGVYVLSKPVNSRIMERSIRFLMSVRKKILKVELKSRATEDKMEELRIVTKAKFCLVEKKKMTEEEAHRYIGKQAMNSGLSRKRIAEKIIDDMDDS